MLHWLLYHHQYQAHFHWGMILHTHQKMWSYYSTNHTLDKLANYVRSNICVLCHSSYMIYPKFHCCVIKCSRLSCGMAHHALRWHTIYYSTDGQAHSSPYLTTAEINWFQKVFYKWYMYSKHIHQETHSFHQFYGGKSSVMYFNYFCHMTND